MDVQFIFKIEKQPLEGEAFYARLGKLLDALSTALPEVNWYLNPANPKEAARPCISFSEKDAFMARVKQRYEESVHEWPEYPFLYDALLTSAKDAKAFKSVAGRCSLTFTPGHGDIRLEALEPNNAWPNVEPVKWAKEILRAVVREEWIMFASVDVSERKREGRGRDYYQIHHRAFPHRQFLGWMGFVQRLPPRKLITAEDLPQAAEVIPLPGRAGTLIVAVKDAFDVFNPQHIKQAQQVEMRLVDLDALPVIDPAFMG